MKPDNELETSKLWQQSVNLTKIIEEFVRTIPTSEHYTISDPLHTTAISVSADIATGIGKADKEGLFDFRYARGYMFKIKGLVLVCQELGYSASITPVLVEIEALRRLLDSKITELEDEAKDDN